MEKKLYDLEIDPELQALIPPLSADEYEMLEESILRNGCDTPLIVWHSVIVDGHNRYEICQRHRIPFSIEDTPMRSPSSSCTTRSAEKERSSPTPCTITSFNHIMPRGTASLCPGGSSYAGH